MQEKSVDFINRFYIRDNKVKDEEMAPVVIILY